MKRGKGHGGVNVERERRLQMERKPLHEVHVHHHVRHMSLAQLHLPG